VEFQFSIDNKQRTAQMIPLKLLAEQLVSKFQLLAIRNGSTIFNDVPVDLYVNADHDILVKVICSLLSSVISGSRNSYIRISAKRYNNIILFHLKDSNTAFTHNPRHDWHEVNMLAGKLGGCISEDDIIKKHGTITFSFCSGAIAA
jgi:hypothetical protein